LQAAASSPEAAAAVKILAEVPIFILSLLVNIR
jgi:hypothetical protein